MDIKNIFENIPQSLTDEFFEEIIDNGNFKLERIISNGHTSPDNFWYDQVKNEFVILLSGSAILEFENESVVNLYPGDYIIIPAHKKHRVVQTSGNQKTFWLALHY